MTVYEMELFSEGKPVSIGAIYYYLPEEGPGQTLLIFQDRLHRGGTLGEQHLHIVTKYGRESKMTPERLAGFRGLPEAEVDDIAKTVAEVLDLAGFKPSDISAEISR